MIPLWAFAGQAESHLSLNPFSLGRFELYHMTQAWPVRALHPLSSAGLWALGNQSLSEKRVKTGGNWSWRGGGKASKWTSKTEREWEREITGPWWYLNLWVKADSKFCVYLQTCQSWENKHLLDEAMELGFLSLAVERILTHLNGS